VHGLRAVSGLDVPFTPPWTWIAVVPVMAFATSLLASVFPALRLSRISPAQAVRYE
jgi:ABC-type lipoprotein release transport system permease subunit